jgi:hypothetical protein
MISSSFEGGREVGSGSAVSDQGELLFNAYIGTALQLTEYLQGFLSYNFTDSDSDFDGRSYDRNRVSIGLTAEF